MEERGGGNCSRCVAPEEEETAGALCIFNGNPYLLQHVHHNNNHHQSSPAHSFANDGTSPPIWKWEKGNKGGDVVHPI